MTTLSPAAREYLLAFADDEHTVGAHHASWIGMGPFLEEDLAFCSIAQDELGHALALYDYLVEPAELDRFVLLRDPADYRCCALTEATCPTWPLAMVRHWLYDEAEGLRWDALHQSSVPGLPELARQANREESFHRSHAAMMMKRICADSVGRAELQAAFDELAGIAASLWQPPQGESDALAAGVANVSFRQMAAAWSERIASDGADWGLRIDQAALVVIPAGSRHQRSPDFADLHTSIGEVISLDPIAVW